MLGELPEKTTTNTLRHGETANDVLRWGLVDKEDYKQSLIPFLENTSTFKESINYYTNVQNIAISDVSIAEKIEWYTQQNEIRLFFAQNNGGILNITGPKAFRDFIASSSLLDIQAKAYDTDVTGAWNEGINLTDAANSSLYFGFMAYLLSDEIRVNSFLATFQNIRDVKRLQRIVDMMQSLPDADDGMIANINEFLFALKQNIADQNMMSKSRMLSHIRNYSQKNAKSICERFYMRYKKADYLKEDDIYKIFTEPQDINKCVENYFPHYTLESLYGASEHLRMFVISDSLQLYKYYTDILKQIGIETDLITLEDIQEL